MAVASLETRRVVRDWTGRRVTVMGLGRHGGGIGAVRFLAQRGAQVTVSDAAHAAELTESLSAIADLPIHALKLGGHDERDFRAAEYVVVNPAVRPGHPCLAAARLSGAVITSEIELFLERSPSQIIAVTGSNGKSTTVTMLAEILRAAGRRAWLGGNLGGSLLGELDAMAADDWVVVELSSFQLAHLGVQVPPVALAAITNCTPNHLDWHGSFAAYAAAKRRLLRSVQTPAILNPFDPLVGSWSNRRDDGTVRRWFGELPELAVPGQHNRQNAACAAAAAEVAGVKRSIIVRSLANFAALEHRLQGVATIGGVRYYNDSKSTSPGATIAALDAIPGPIWLLAGGVSKAVPLDPWSCHVVQRARGAGLFGAARDELRASLARQCAGFRATSCETLAEALDWCRQQAQAGDAILLSPGCASYDQFRDYEDRGRAFCRLVQSKG